MEYISQHVNYLRADTIKLCTSNHSEKLDLSLDFNSLTSRPCLLQPVSSNQSDINALPNSIRPRLIAVEKSQPSVAKILLIKMGKLDCIDYV